MRKPSLGAIRPWLVHPVEGEGFLDHVSIHCCCAVSLRPEVGSVRIMPCSRASFPKALLFAGLEQLIKKGSLCLGTGSSLPVELQDLKITTCFLFYTEKKYAVYFVMFTISESLNFFYMYF